MYVKYITEVKMRILCKDYDDDLRVIKAAMCIMVNWEYSYGAKKKKWLYPIPKNTQKPGLWTLTVYSDKIEPTSGYTSSQSAKYHIPMPSYEEGINKIKELFEKDRIDLSDFYIFSFEDLKKRIK